MPRITVHIDSKTYHLECEEGQQSYLIKLTQKLGKYINNIRTDFGELHHQQAVIMAALMAIDELTYAKLTQKKLNKQLELAMQGEINPASKNTAALILEAANKIKAISESLAEGRSN